MLAQAHVETERAADETMVVEATDTRRLESDQAEADLAVLLGRRFLVLTPAEPSEVVGREPTVDAALDRALGERDGTVDDHGAIERSRDKGPNPPQ